MKTPSWPDPDETIVMWLNCVAFSAPGTGLFEAETYALSKIVNFSVPPEDGIVRMFYRFFIS